MVSWSYLTFSLAQFTHSYSANSFHTHRSQDSSSWRKIFNRVLNFGCKKFFDMSTLIFQHPVQISPTFRCWNLAVKCVWTWALGTLILQHLVQYRRYSDAEISFFVHEHTNISTPCIISPTFRSSFSFGWAVFIAFAAISPRELIITLKMNRFGPVSRGREA